MRLFPSVLRRPPSSRLFPYTTLFRSGRAEGALPLPRGPVPGAVRPLRPVPRDRPRRVLPPGRLLGVEVGLHPEDRKSTRLNSSHVRISYAVFCLKKKNIELDLPRSAV